MKEMKKALRITILLISILLIGYNHSLGQETYNEEESITLYLGEIKVFSVDNPRRVAISNPDVVDISSISKDELLIMPKAVGISSLIWWDDRGQHSLQLQVFAEEMSALKQRIDRLLEALDLPDISTRRADSEGKILLLGKVKTPEDLERIDTALDQLKDKVTNLIKIEEEGASIEIDVQVLELAKGANKTLGFTVSISSFKSFPKM